MEHKVQAADEVPVNHVQPGLQQQPEHELEVNGQTFQAAQGNSAMLAVWTNAPAAIDGDLTLVWEAKDDPGAVSEGTYKLRAATSADEAVLFQQADYARARAVHCMHPTIKRAWMIIAHKGPLVDVGRAVEVRVQLPDPAVAEAKWVVLRCDLKQAGDEDSWSLGMLKLTGWIDPKDRLHPVPTDEQLAGLWEAYGEGEWSDEEPSDNDQPVAQ